MGGQDSCSKVVFAFAGIAKHDLLVPSDRIVVVILSAIGTLVVG